MHICNYYRQDRCTHPCLCKGLHEPACSRVMQSFPLLPFCEISLIHAFLVIMFILYQLIQVRQMRSSKRLDMYIHVRVKNLNYYTYLKLTYWQNQHLGNASGADYSLGKAYLPKCVIGNELLSRMVVCWSFTNEALTNEIGIFVVMPGPAQRLIVWV